MSDRKSDHFKALTFRLRHPADAQLAALAHKHHTNKTEYVHRLIKEGYEAMQAEEATPNGA